MSFTPLSMSFTPEACTGGEKVRKFAQQKSPLFARCEFAAHDILKSGQFGKF